MSPRHAMMTANRNGNAVSTRSRVLRWARTAALVVCVVACLRAATAAADTTLTVDLATTLGPVTHTASGSLYGLVEDRPADLDALVEPLHPSMFVNPAANVQQPHGDAIVVAARVAPLGARVTIRLADWFPGWPYNFTNTTDWLNKIGETVTRKQASGVDNYYGYEIWNEPDGTWTSGLAFNDFWKLSHDELRALDPDAAIIGPSIAWYNANYLRDFLTFARDNDCLPDIVCWHELGGGDVAGHLESYRALEQQLGMGPLPISINEYSGEEWLDDEGQPGASAPIIAKFERYRVDTACISYWDVPHPGRLGSLLATDTERNGGWWFYKWYGDMSGEMVSTTPAAPNEVSTLDGFANLDVGERYASVVFAGVNDGTLRVVVQGFGATAVFGSKVHVEVERTPWVSRSSVVSATEVIDSLEVQVDGDRIEVTVPNANDTDGYRILLRPVDDGEPDAGTLGGSGGSAGSGGTAASGGVGGGGMTGGSAGALAGSGGVAAGAGDTGGSGGGVAGAAGVIVAVGGAGAGGNPVAPPLASNPNVGVANDDADAGCSCRAGAGRERRRAGALSLLLLGAVWLRWRRARPGRRAAAR